MKKIEIKLPEFKIQKTISILSETKDWGLLTNNIPKTWEITKGEGINIFILDTAGSSDHSDLKENIIGGINFSDSSDLLDRNGHGTHCAGIIAASENDMGVVGVAPKAKIFLVKVLDDSGNGSVISIEKGLRFCYESLDKEIKPHIISMSLGSSSELGHGTHFWIKKLYEKNIPIICAAGNSGQEGVNYPAKYQETIAIGAYDSKENLANFSTTGEEVDFTAPGVDIYSTWIENNYARISGTSMATPFVAGIVALLLAKHKKQEAETGMNDCKTISQIKEHLIKYSIDKGDIGKDNQWGYGIIDVDKLILE